MISLKDVTVIVSLAGSIVTGSVYVHDIKRDVAELGSDYRMHVAAQQETELWQKKWKLEERLKNNPQDTDARHDLERVNMLLQKNLKQQKQLKGTAQ